MMTDLQTIETSLYSVDHSYTMSDSSPKAKLTPAQSIVSAHSTRQLDNNAVPVRPNTILIENTKIAPKRPSPNFQALKDSLQLDFNKAAKIEKVQSTPDILIALQGLSPDLEKLFCGVTTSVNTPTPTSILFPKLPPTSEQEQFAEPFAEELKKLHNSTAGFSPLTILNSPGFPGLSKLFAAFSPSRDVVGSISKQPLILSSPTNITTLTNMQQPSASTSMALSHNQLSNPNDGSIANTFIIQGIPTTSFANNSNPNGNPFALVKTEPNNDDGQMHMMLLSPSTTGTNSGYTATLINGNIPHSMMNGGAGTSHGGSYIMNNVTPALTHPMGTSSPMPNMEPAPKRARMQQPSDLQQVPNLMMNPAMQHVVGPSPQRSLSARPSSANSNHHPIDMQDQERIKLERKRERNRVAASKCRQRKMDRIQELEEEVKEIEAQLKAAEMQRDILHDEVQGLTQTLNQHARSGCSVVINKLIR